MRIAGVKAVMPSQVIDNRRIKAMVTEQSVDLTSEQLRDALKRIGYYLIYSGSNKRHWLGDGEKPFDLLQQAISGALDQAGVRRSDVDLIIYTGVDRGFLEPAMAYMVGAAFGMPQAHCFDIVDACMSWVRAIFVAYSMFGTGLYKNALIVNCEFSMHPGGRVNPGCFHLDNVDEVEWNFPAYTVGEAASATFLVRDDSRPWEFHFSSQADLSDLCSVPLEGFDRYCQPQPRLGRNGPNQFTAFGNDMFRLGKEHGIEIFTRLSIPHDEIKEIFPHAASKRLWMDMGAAVGVEDKIRFIYPDYGNLVSASVPAAIAMAQEEGTIQRGETLAGWVGSAGMSFASFSFQF
ncbi:3-oxoacyl-[acyl-carrier-protein] synthase III C-terminal domain-containing protein [Granulicella mallensis]|uniref:3-Oxoacyl-(Acyl-carrier-protein (ACP)) synthase III domain-containing protein n=1 Tax=Granulicella mallensis (strain ATCC BAA-1857 / DSM 23137 / MP5ACTX8) TaxID=682795 RepID=G8NYJ5_GRAMM|nr:3-oxoacyl-[acyl-carrier-protein] synthase III C-terminal domain-containing protein [Granulicella mallensis]AEU39054.1 3-Oxoacyl-(acyl-carrier-protein (ACP)) synthase III domain-containing protein [Granulicella mallensis MP5ACTX8]